MVSASIATDAEPRRTQDRDPTSMCLHNQLKGSGALATLRAETIGGVAGRWMTGAEAGASALEASQWQGDSRTGRRPASPPSSRG
jgi:hypothetical protein